jgi:hypothetical protein
MPKDGDDRRCSPETNEPMAIELAPQSRYHAAPRPPLTGAAPSTTIAGQILAHRSRCVRPQLRLQALARIEPGEVTSRGAIASEVRDATNTVIAEAEAAGRDALATAAGGREHAEVFLGVRLARLMTAADDAVSAAHSGDAARLRRQLRHFEALASAIWTVQRAVYGQAPA